MNRKEDTVFSFRVGDAASVIAAMNKLERTDPVVANMKQKLADVVARPFFSDILEPFYTVNSIKSLERGEEAAVGQHFLRLTDSLGLAEFSHQYEKALIEAEEKCGAKRSIENVSTTLNIYTPASNSVHSFARLRVTFVRSSGGGQEMGYTTEEAHEFDYSFIMSHSDSIVHNVQMPDIEERSIASPVYLVNSQNVKSVFGYTVKDDPLAIYLCARYYGWSEVMFYGQQVLLKADIVVR